MKDFKETYDYCKQRELHLNKKEQNYLKQLTKLNSFYTELEYEQDKETIQKIKKQIYKIEKELRDEVK